MKIGDEFIFKSKVTHGSIFYNEQGIPSDIGGFRGKIMFLENNKKRMGYQIYWHNKLIANEYGAHNSCWTGTKEIERIIDGNE